MGIRAPSRPWAVALGVCALTLLVLVVFFPVVGFEFVESDVLLQVVYNPYIRGLTAENVRQIFTSPWLGSYYPVRTLTYALDYQIWGSNAGGFKLTNGLIHLANLYLVFWLVLRLVRREAPADRPPPAGWDVSVAAISAGIFAIHPVVVEPVVWVSGREELLMVLGALGCFHFHLTARRLSQDGDKSREAAACHVAAAFFCAVACLSNAVGAVIPLLVTVWDLLTLPNGERSTTSPDSLSRRGRGQGAESKKQQAILRPLSRLKWRRIVAGTVALWALGILTVVMKGSGREVVVARELETLSLQRLTLVLNVYWLNLRSLVWPVDLALDYGWLVPESFLEPGVILGGIAACLTLVVLWKLRHSKLVLLGVLWFGLALGPGSQVMPHHVHRADRFLYLPLVGLAVALGAGLRLLTGVSRQPTPTRLASEEGETAIPRSRVGFASRPAALGIMALGAACLIMLTTLSMREVQSWQNSVTVWEKCVQSVPKNPVCHRALADSLAKRGQLERAFPHYREALRLEPSYVGVLRNFAFYLVTCPDDALRDEDLAIELAERGCQVTRGGDPDLMRTLAMAYADAGRFEEAVSVADTARQLAERIGNGALAEELQRQLTLYQEGRGHREAQNGGR